MHNVHFLNYSLEKAENRRKRKLSMRTNYFTLIAKTLCFRNNFKIIQAMDFNYSIKLDEYI